MGVEASNIRDLIKGSESQVTVVPVVLTHQLIGIRRRSVWTEKLQQIPIQCGEAATSTLIT